MISNPDWTEPKEKPYMHQVSIGCIEKLVDCQKQFNEDKIDYTKWLKTIIDFSKTKLASHEGRIKKIRVPTSWIPSSGLQRCERKIIS